MGSIVSNRAALRTTTPLFGGAGAKILEPDGLAVGCDQ